MCTIALYLDKEQAIFSFNERIQLGTLTNRPYMKRPKRFVSEVLALERLDPCSNGVPFTCHPKDDSSLNYLALIKIER